MSMALASNPSRVAATAGRCRLLLVDDHADTRELLERLLSRDFTVDTARCYESALAAAARATPDLVISDIGLPGRSGIELMRELRARYGVSGIAVTGHLLDDPAVLRAAGFAKFLLKPIQLDELLRAIDASCPTMAR
jgi:DNA-binding response OmpR family regulator